MSYGIVEEASNTTAISSGSSSSARSPRTDPRRVTVLLDANALLLSARTRFPLNAEVERVCPGALLSVPESVIGELDGLAVRGVAGARLASALARKFPRIPAVGRGDAAILEAATRVRAWVVTADRELADRLHARGVTVLAPRDRHRLESHPGRARGVRAERPSSRRAAHR